MRKPLKTGVFKGFFVFHPPEEVPGGHAKYSFTVSLATFAQA